MLPQTNGLLGEKFTEERKPSKTPRWDIEGERIMGETDGLEAVKQAVYTILSVERYEYLIHSGSFGIELRELFGKPVPYVLPELKRRITEALTQDDRIEDVTGFSFETKRGKVFTSFVVQTVFGDVRMEKEVEIGV